ncbi:SAP16 [Scenedesmus sp. PABB004]|nr:SAP16 [Scenedesmus sp. PABB004]
MWRRALAAALLLGVAAAAAGTEAAPAKPAAAAHHRASTAAKPPVKPAPAKPAAAAHHARQPAAKPPAMPAPAKPTAAAHHASPPAAKPPAPPPVAKQAAKPAPPPGKPAARPVAVAAAAERKPAPRQAPAAPPLAQLSVGAALGLAGPLASVGALFSGAAAAVGALAASLLGGLQGAHEALAPAKPPRRAGPAAVPKPAPALAEVPATARSPPALPPGLVPSCEWRRDLGACTVARAYLLALPGTPESFVAKLVSAAAARDHACTAFTTPAACLDLSPPGLGCGWAMSSGAAGYDDGCHGTAMAEWAAFAAQPLAAAGDAARAARALTSVNGLACPGSLAAASGGCGNLYPMDGAGAWAPRVCSAAAGPSAAGCAFEASSHSCVASAAASAASAALEASAVGDCSAACYLRLLDACARAPRGLGAPQARAWCAARPGCSWRRGGCAADVFTPGLDRWGRQASDAAAACGAQGSRRACEEAGARARVPDCAQLDFLPFTCDACGATTCLQHRTYASHACAAAAGRSLEVLVCPLCAKGVRVGPGADPHAAWEAHAGSVECDPENYGRVHRKPRCGAPGCREKLSVINAYTCKVCGQRVCLKHRHEDDHACKGRAAHPLAQRQQPASAVAAAAAAVSAAGRSLLSELRGGGSAAPATGRPAAQQRPQQQRQQQRQQQQRAAAAEPTNTVHGSAERRRQLLVSARRRCPPALRGSPRSRACGVRRRVTVLPPRLPPPPPQGLPPRSTNEGGEGAERCPHCPARFASVAALIAHAEAAHAERRGDAPEVVDLTGSQPSPRGGGERFGCPRCGGVFADAVALVAHSERCGQGGAAQEAAATTCVLS